MKDSSLSAESVLRIADGVRWRSPKLGQLAVEIGEQSVRLPWRVLSIFSALEHPVRLAELVKKCSTEVTGALDWVELTTLVKQLIKLGVLVYESLPNSAARVGWPRAQGREIEMHIELLDDQARTHAYIRSIERTVQPGDIVVDLGTGNAVLAMAAARAGAKRVYAIEASTFSDVAEQIVSANGLSDRITVLRGWSNRIDLPERADVIVSEIIGNDPFGEGVLRFLPDAIRRFLKPNGRVIPECLAVELQVLEMPEMERLRHRIPGTRLAQWSEAYGFDFSPFSQYAAASVRHSMHFAREIDGWGVLGAAVPLLEIKFSELFSAEGSARLIVESERKLGAALVVRTKLGMPGFPEYILCGGCWRWPVKLLPEHPLVNRWQIEARWGALIDHLELVCKAADD